jgi:hypothetical protein
VGNICVERRKSEEIFLERERVRKYLESVNIPGKREGGKY